MNLSGIEWCDFTWNPLTGCLHGCLYCYARIIAENPRTGHHFPKGFKPDQRFERLSQPSKRKKGAAVFVGSMTDMMGMWWTNQQIQRVIDVCRDNPQHTFLWLSKEPARYADFEWPDNCYLGATVTKQEDIKRVDELMKVNAWRFLSIEPMLGPVSLSDFRWKGIHQIIAGCQNGRGAKAADPGWFRALRDQIEDKGIHFFLKKVNKKTDMLEGKTYKSLMWELKK